MRIHLRNATMDDLPLFTKWDDMPHLKNQVPTSDWNWIEELIEEHPFWRNQFIAVVENIPIGYLEIIDPYYETSQYWGKVQLGLRAIDIWIGEPQYLGKGYGKKIMNLAIKFCFIDPSVYKILIDPYASNTRAHKFYENLGFQFVEERDFEGDRCYVYELTRERYATDIAYLFD